MAFSAWQWCWHKFICRKLVHFLLFISQSAEKVINFHRNKILKLPTKFSATTERSRREFQIGCDVRKWRDKSIWLFYQWKTSLSFDKCWLSLRKLHYDHSIRRKKHDRISFQSKPLRHWKQYHQIWFPLQLSFCDCLFSLWSPRRVVFFVRASRAAYVVLILGVVVIVVVFVEELPPPLVWTWTDMGTVCQHLRVLVDCLGGRRM